MYISYYEYMAVIAEIYCWWLLIDKFVFRLDLHLFYLLVYLNLAFSKISLKSRPFVFRFVIGSLTSQP